MLFWHLLGRENAHIRSSMLRFSLGRSFKIAIVIQFLNYILGVSEDIRTLFFIVSRHNLQLILVLFS